MRRHLARIVPLAAIAVAIVSLVFLRPEAEYLLAELSQHREVITAWVAAHFALAVLAYGLLYFATKALFLPTGPMLTAAGGLLLGTAAATLTSALAGLLAAAALYLLVEFGFARGLRARAIPTLERAGFGFRRYGFSYLLTMRLVPVIPFWVGCVVPAVLGVNFATYIAATLIGSLPSIFLYASLGAGLGTLIEEGNASFSAVSQPGILLPLLGLAALSLAPVLWSKLRGRGTAPRSVF